MMIRQRRNTTQIYSTIFRMRKELKRKGLLTPEINNDIKLIIRDYKQSLIKELEVVTQNEAWYISNNN